MFEGVNCDELFVAGAPKSLYRQRLLAIVAATFRLNLRLARSLRGYPDVPA